MCSLLDVTSCVVEQEQYTEFTAYAALLAGASPPVIQKSVVGRHQQTWKLREHHLVVNDPADSDSGIDVTESDRVIPLRGGDPLRSYFPTGTQIIERRDGLRVQNPADDQEFTYQRHSFSEMHKQNARQTDATVQDIIITGEVSCFTNSMAEAELTDQISRDIRPGANSILWDA